MLLLKYVLGIYGRLLWRTLLALLVLYLIIDIMDHADDLGGLQGVADWSAYLSSVGVFALYQLMPAATLIAATVFLTGLAATSELTIMLSAGLSGRRIFAPVILVSLLLALGHPFLGELAHGWAQPEFERLRSQEPGSSPVRGIADVRGGDLWVRSPEGDRILHVGRFDLSPEQNRLQRVRVYDLEASVLVGRIQAPEARVETGDWLVLSQVQQVDLRSGQQWQLEQLRLQFPGLRTAAVASYRKLSEYSLAELWRDLQDLRQVGARWEPYLAELCSRLSRSLAIVVLPLMALPFGMQVQRSAGRVFGVALGMLMSLLYLGVDSMALALARAGALHPAISPFLANLVFMGVLALFWPRLRAVL